MTTDIAIVGMAGLFAGARNMHSYWQNILNKVDCIKEAPDEWAQPYFDPQAEPRADISKIYTRKVGLLGDLATFNPIEFGIPPTAVDGDAGHFLALKLARDALQDANYLERPFPKETTGIILGRGSNPNRADIGGIQHGMIVDQTMDLLGQLLPQLDNVTLGELRQQLKESLPSTEIEKAPCLISNVASGRIANRLDLMGPNYIVDAACSSCLIAVESAIQELLSGRSDMMLAGGIQGAMPALIYQLFCQLNALSRTDIRPFDAAGNGTLLSEGVGFLVLKRLADAQRDGDRIYAVIKGIGISSDGKAKGLLAPRLEGEIKALQRAYEQTGIDPATISLIEAHGTGIPLGDQTEIQALGSVFGQRTGNIPSCGIGSVKSMIGHCIPASGVASLIKTSLALYYKTLPPTLCDQVNPDLGIENTPFYVNNEARPWIHGAQYPRRAGVNAFGFGGINAHAILEEYNAPPVVDSTSSIMFAGGAALESRREPLHISQQPTELLLFAGDSRQQVLELVNQVQQFLEINPDTELANLAYTLAQRPNGSHRLAIIAKDVSNLQHKLTQVVGKLAQLKKDKLPIRNGIYYTENRVEKGKTAFLFSSEGAQYPNMLADLCLYFPQVRQWFDFLDQAFEREIPPSSLIFPPPTSLTPSQQEWVNEQIYASDIATEALFSASMGLYELLSDLGIKCEIMVGHSAGEHIAAGASGLAGYDNRDELKAALKNVNRIYRDLEVSNKIPTGVLMSVGGVADEFVEQLIANSKGTVHLVADNCANQRLIFTTETHSNLVANQIKEAGGLCVPLPFNRAYHTPLFQPAVEALSSHYETIKPGSSRAKLYSCATTEPYPQEPKAARALSAQQWVLPVRFRETIEKLYRDEEVRTFIEVGAGSNLTSFVDNILRGRDYLAVASNSQRKSGLSQLQGMLARLFINGKSVQMLALYQYRQVATLDLAQPLVHRPQSEPVLSLMLPKMSLKPEFVSKVQEKISGSKLELQSQILEVAEPNLIAGEQTLEKSNEIAEPSRSPLDQTLGQDEELRENGINLSPDNRLALLEEHFSLMQEFLDNQERVTNLLFSSQGGEVESDAEQN